MTSTANPDFNSDLRILVIDDEEHICTIFRELFSEFDITVDTADSGSLGLKKAFQNNYSLIFLDFKLGDINGMDVLKILKNNYPDLSIIMISAYLSKELNDELQAMGAETCMKKPLSIIEIMEVTLQYGQSQHLRECLKDNRFFGTG